METIIFYNFILLSSTLFVRLSEKGRTNFDRRFLLGIAFLLVFIPAAIRYDVGTDYLSYVSIFESPSILENYKIKEPGFYFITWFLKTNGFHFQWMFVIFAFIFTFIAFKAYPRKNAWLLHFLFFSMLWFSSFNIMRQTTALAWCFLAIFYFFERKYIWFIVLILIASTFHKSAIFILIVGGIACIPLRFFLKGYLLPIIFIIGIIITYLFFNSILNFTEQFLNILGFSRYANYFNNPVHFIKKDFGTGLGILVKILFSIYIISNTKKLIEINKNYWFISVLSFFYSVSLVLASRIVILDRMADAFSITPIIGAYLLLQIPTSRQLNKLILILFLMFLLLSFFKLSLSIPTSYADPKRMPYQTIFME